MINPITPKQQTMIVNNIKKVITNQDISLLSKQAYNFLYLCNGFIAHYNLQGFQDHYIDTSNLKSKILNCQEINQFDNFNKNDSDYEYYMSKKETYNKIVNAIHQ